MIYLCSWCKVKIKEVEPLDDLRVSNGICPICFEKEMGKLNLKPVNIINEK